MLCAVVCQKPYACPGCLIPKQSARGVVLSIAQPNVVTSIVRTPAQFSVKAKNALDIVVRIGREVQERVIVILAANDNTRLPALISENRAL